MFESTVVRWFMSAMLVVAIVALIAYARGDDSDEGRSPERGSSLGALVVR